MAHITASVEYAIHGLLWLVDEGRALSAKDIAELQGLSPSFVAKIFPKLEKAGIVAAQDGVRGGYRLARAPEAITFLAIVDAIEGEKPLFDCQEVRARCTLFTDGAPDWATRGPCAIHAVMLQAEAAMRETLAAQTLADVAGRFARKAPESFAEDISRWIDGRHGARTAKRTASEPPG